MRSRRGVCFGTRAHVAIAADGGCPRPGGVEAEACSETLAARPRAFACAARDRGTRAAALGLLRARRASHGAQARRADVRRRPRRDDPRLPRRPGRARRPSDVLRHRRAGGPEPGLRDRIPAPWARARRARVDARALPGDDRRAARRRARAHGRGPAVAQGASTTRPPAARNPLTARAGAPGGRRLRHGPLVARLRRLPDPRLRGRRTPAPPRERRAGGGRAAARDAAVDVEGASRSDTRTPRRGVRAGHRERADEGEEDGSV